jgi:aryl-alcohol dehydrogenase-like predicted oxidoreductase
MIPSMRFGRTEHISSRVIFGGYALCQASSAEAKRALELLLEHGVNHIDTAPSYGLSEQHIGLWMEKHRDRFFLATKTRARTRRGALDDLKKSLARLRVESIDLWQMHGLTGSYGQDRALASGGTIDAFHEAREKGLVRFLGVTGHGVKAPVMHRESLDRAGFDSVLLPYNYTLMQNPKYATAFRNLDSFCRRKQVALQTIKAIARRPWGERPRTHNTYFYEPLVEELAIEAAVQWVMGHPTAFLLSAGDLGLLPAILKAASRPLVRPSDEQMDELVSTFAMAPIFRS